VVSDLHQRVVEELFVVCRQLDLIALSITQVRHHVLADIVQPIMSEPKATRGKVAVATLFLFGGFLQHQHARALQMRIDRGTERCVAGAGNDDVIGVGIIHRVHFPWSVAA